MKSSDKQIAVVLNGILEDIRKAFIMANLFLSKQTQFCFPQERVKNGSSLAGLTAQMKLE